MVKSENIIKLRQAFSDEYPHIYIEEISDSTLETYNNSTNPNWDISRNFLDRLCDYLLSNGLAETDE